MAAQRQIVKTTLMRRATETCDVLLKKSVLFYTTRSDREIADHVLRRKIFRGHFECIEELPAWLVARCTD